jgi:hypothetical protein
MHRRRILLLIVSVVVAGPSLIAGGCSLGDIGHYFASFNPCGSVLNCNPTTYTFITSGYRGPGLNPKVDPSCTYPPFCGTSDPFVY